MKNIVTIVLLAAALLASCEVVDPEVSGAVDAPVLFEADVYAEFVDLAPSTSDYFELWLIAPGDWESADTDAEYLAAGYKVAEEHFAQTGNYTQYVRISSSEYGGGDMLIFMAGFFDNVAEPIIVLQSSHSLYSITDGALLNVTFQY